MAIISISLTDFIDFVSKTGSTKQTQVKNVKYRYEYHPAKDYYKYIREGIIEVHQTKGGKSDFEDLVKYASDPRKQDNFAAAIKGYLKFLGRKKTKWIDPPFHHWQVGELDVKVNPEIGLSIDGAEHFIKLYFKADKLSKIKASEIMHLMESELRNQVGNKALFAVLDVREGKLYVNETKDKSLVPLLIGEANSFQAIWKLI